jgi:hypothetical protein
MIIDAPPSEPAPNTDNVKPFATLASLLQDSKGAIESWPYKKAVKSPSKRVICVAPTTVLIGRPRYRRIASLANCIAATISLRTVSIVVVKVISEPVAGRQRRMIRRVAPAARIHPPFYPS